MFSANEKMTVQNPSAPTDGEQSPKQVINSITPDNPEIKTQAKKERLRLLGSQLTHQSSKNFLPTVNLEELFDEVYDDVERGERGSTEEHLTVTQFKVMKETEKLEALEEKFEKSESEYQSLVDKTKVRKTVKKGFDEIEEIGKTNFFGKVEMTQDDCTYLKERAKLSMIQETQITDLKNKLSSAKKDIGIWKKRYEALYEQTKEFLEAVKKAPEKIKTVIQQILHTEKVSTRTPREKHKNDVEH